MILEPLETEMREVVAKSTFPEKDPMVFIGRKLCFASKNTSQHDDSHIAALSLYERPRAASPSHYVLIFEKKTHDGDLIISDFRVFRKLERLAQSVRPDKLHRRICELMGVRHLMQDMQIEDINSGED